MNKVFKAVKALSLIVRKPVLLNRVLQEPDVWKDHVTKRYGLKKGLLVVNPAVLLGDEYAENLRVFTSLDGGSLITDIALLKALARRFDKCRYFEIGTWRGESAANLADVAEEVVTLNISDDEMRSNGVDEGYILQQGVFSGGNERIRHVRANSRNYDFSLSGRPFDVIFIDGSHHYEDVRHDTEQVYKHLVHEESVIVWHDYGVTPEDVRFEVLAGILDGIPSSEHKNLYHVAHTKSAIFTRRTLNAYPLEKPVFPDHFYSVELTYNAFQKK